MIRTALLLAAIVYVTVGSPAPVSNVFEIDISPEEAQRYLSSPPFSEPQLSGRTATLPLVRWNDPRFRSAEAGPTLGHYWKNGREIENTDDYVEEVYDAQQFHGQDGLGAYSYGYSAPESSKVENRERSGDVTGSYTYRDGNNELIKVRYWADSEGFHQEDNLPKVELQPAQETEEVREARLAHEKAWQEAAAAAAANPDPQGEYSSNYDNNQDSNQDYRPGQNLNYNQNSNQNYRQGQNQNYNQNSNQNYRQGQNQNFNQNQQQSYKQHKQNYKQNQDFDYRASASGVSPAVVPAPGAQSSADAASASTVASDAPTAPDSTPAVSAAPSVAPLSAGGDRESRQFTSHGAASYSQQPGAYSQQQKSYQQSQYSQSGNSISQQSASASAYAQSGPAVKQSHAKYEEPEPTGPPRGFFYSFTYPVSIIVSKNAEGSGHHGVHAGTAIDHDTVGVNVHRA